MDKKEKAVQNALGTLSWWMVTLKIRRRAEKRHTFTRVIKSASKNDATEEVIQLCMENSPSYRRDQIAVERCIEIHPDGRILTGESNP